MGLQPIAVVLPGSDREQLHALDQLGLQQLECLQRPLRVLGQDEGEVLQPALLIGNDAFTQIVERERDADADRCGEQDAAQDDRRNRAGARG
jgi:hypothetical protein